MEYIILILSLVLAIIADIADIKITAQLSDKQVLDDYLIRKT